jgi:hypothetical protein
MAVKYIDLFRFKALQNFTQTGIFLFENSIPSGNPGQKWFEMVSAENEKKIGSVGSFGRAGDNRLLTGALKK